MCHGTMDDVVNFSWGKSSWDLLHNHGFTVDFKSYQNMGHSASQEELIDILKFMKSNLAEV